MVKQIISIAVASVLSCGIANASDNASIEGKEKITRNGVDIYLEPNSANKQKYLSGEFDAMLSSMKKEYEEIKKQPQPKEPAKPVSKVLIQYIKSTQGGKEVIKQNQGSTIKDHGGKEFMAITNVIGHGGLGYDSATYAGMQVTMSKEDSIDLDGDRIIDGWVDYWNLAKTNFPSGKFTYTSRSINVDPTMSVSIQIK